MGSFLANVQGAVLLIRTRVYTGLLPFPFDAVALVSRGSGDGASRSCSSQTMSTGRGAKVCLLSWELTNHLSSHPCTWSKGCSGRGLWACALRTRAV